MVDKIIRLGGYRFKASDVISYYKYQRDYEYAGYDSIKVELKRQEDVIAMKDDLGNLDEWLEFLDRQMDEYYQLLNEFNMAKAQSGGFNGGNRRR